MKNLLFLLLLAVSMLFTTTPIYAHPGRTASDGCHYCRTNCDSWGVPWNERHCHNGYAEPAPQVYIQPTSIPTPTLIPTKIPTLTPFPTNTPTPTQKPEVKGESITYSSPTPTIVLTQASEDSNNVLGGLIAIGAFISFGYLIFRKVRGITNNTGQKGL